jgi:splicing suppressor protein 51
MRSSASYTCQRCLGALGSFQRPISSSIPSRTRVSQGLKQRLFSTKNSPPSLSIASRTASKKEIGRRAASTAKPEGQIAKNASTDFRSPNAFASTPIPETSSRPLLLPNNLFHSFSDSPSPEIRRRAAFIKQNAYCSHPDHRQTRLSTNPDEAEARKEVTGILPPAHVDFECPDCGIPVSCSEEHWADDYEAHLEICDTLREINEDDHDLRSGRFFPEFEYPGDQIEEAMVNMTNWDTFLYSREFQAINDERSLRQATRLLTYPATIGSVLHELSPYTIKKDGRLTVEGLKSLSGKFGTNLPRVSQSLIHI